MEVLITDESKLCCEYFHPSFNLKKGHCRAPKNILSSCENLLKHAFLQVSLWLLACLAISGNIGVLVYRQFFSTESASSTAGVLVKSLCVSDLLMGVYMLIIGAAGEHYRDAYVEKEAE